jgi:hypothetical protein
MFVIKVALAVGSAVAGTCLVAMPAFRHSLLYHQLGLGGGGLVTHYRSTDGQIHHGLICDECGEVFLPKLPRAKPMSASLQPSFAGSLLKRMFYYNWHPSRGFGSPDTAIRAAMKREGYTDDEMNPDNRSHWAIRGESLEHVVVSDPVVAVRPSVQAA